MSGHVLAADSGGGSAVDLSGGNLSFVVVVGVIAVIALAVTLREVTEENDALAPAAERPLQEGVNVGNVERWLSVLGGSALAIYGLSTGIKLRSPAGIARRSSR